MQNARLINKLAEKSHGKKFSQVEKKNCVVRNCSDLHRKMTEVHLFPQDAGVELNLGH